MSDDVEKQLLAIQGISPLRFADEGLLRHSFPKDCIRYDRSFLFMLSASHGEKGLLGYKYTDNNLVAVIGYRHNIIYITPIIDRTGGKNLLKLCREISSTIHCRIIVKKFSEENYPNMKQLRKYHLPKYELEDDAYPETVLHLQKLLILPQGDIHPAASNFLKKVKRFKKFAIDFEIRNSIISIEEPKIEQFLMKDPEKYADYMPMIKYLYSHEKDKRYIIMIFLNQDCVQGVYIAEVFSSREIGLYCAVTAKNKPGITEWMDWYFFRAMFLKGIQTVYLGGAESQGIVHFIKKLLPDNPPYFVETVEYDTLV